MKMQEVLKKVNTFFLLKSLTQRGFTDRSARNNALAVLKHACSPASI